MALTSGLTATVALTVTDADTAIALGSGDVPVLGTPRLVALCEEATVAAVAPHLDPGRTTVGTRVEITHLVASPVGAAVAATAMLETVDDNLLTFLVRAREDDRVVAEGSVRRAVVDRSRFLARLER